MAAFPGYVKLGWRDSGEQPRPVVLRLDVERGIARQRRTAADTVVSLPLTLYFDSAADATSFETWFYGTINAGADWFTFTSLRTGANVNARIVGGDMGKLVPSNKTWARTMRQVTLEWVVAAL